MKLIEYITTSFAAILRAAAKESAVYHREIWDEQGVAQSFRTPTLDRPTVAAGLKIHITLR